MAMNFLAIGACLTVLVPATAAAQTVARPSTASALKRTSLFLSGAAAGLGIHESGHVLFGATLGAHPRVARIDYGPIPFFVIDHDEVSRRREFVISSAGFWMQHAGSEWLLSKRPHLKDQRAPFVKGVLTFNIATSVLYSVSAFGRFGPPERDPRSIAASLGRRGVPEPVVGAMILTPALLDWYRFEHADATAARWASRGVKLAAVLLTLAAGW
jgi:hypothetical protein